MSMKPDPLNYGKNRDYKYLRTLPTSGGRSVGVVRSQTKATELDLQTFLDPRRKKW
jgi:hypothetical protein